MCHTYHSKIIYGIVRFACAGNSEFGVYFCLSLMSVSVGLLTDVTQMILLKGLSDWLSPLRFIYKSIH